MRALDITCFNNAWITDDEHAAAAEFTHEFTDTRKGAIAKDEPRARLIIEYSQIHHKTMPGLMVAGRQTTPDSGRRTQQ